MSNPVTHSLMKQLTDERLARFVAEWDVLEMLVIDIYRSGRADKDAIISYRNVQLGLKETYPAFESELEPYWRAASVSGKVLSQDPFAALANLVSADHFVQNWSSMQLLPAARQALNEYLLYRVQAQR